MENKPQYVLIFFSFRAVPRTLPTIMSFHQEPYLVRGGIKTNSRIRTYFFSSFLSAFRNRNGFFAASLSPLSPD